MTYCRDLGLLSVLLVLSSVPTVTHCSLPLTAAHCFSLLLIAAHCCPLLLHAACCMLHAHYSLLTAHYYQRPSLGVTFIFNSSTLSVTKCSKVGSPCKKTQSVYVSKVKSPHLVHAIWNIDKKTYFI
jgi:hypothetical protein